MNTYNYIQKSLNSGMAYMEAIRDTGCDSSLKGEKNLSYKQVLKAYTDLYIRDMFTKFWTG